MTVERQDIASPEAVAQPQPTQTQTNAPSAEQLAQQAQQAFAGQQAEAASQEQAAAEPQAQLADEFQYQLVSGSKYRTVEDLVTGATEKDFTILRMNAENAQLREQLARVSQTHQQGQQAQTPQASQPVALDQGLVDRIAKNIASYPAFSGASQEEIRHEATLQAIAVQEARQLAKDEALAELDNRMRHTEYQQFVQSNPDLQSPLAQHIFDQARMNGTPFRNPQEHLNAVHAEMFRRGIPRSQPVATTAVNEAAAQNQQAHRIFPSINGSSPQPVAPVPAHVQSAIDYAKSRGATEADLARIKETASRFNPVKFQNVGGF